MDTANDPPQKNRATGASGRVSLDVGGVKFTSARTTLTSNSAYFDAALSPQWNEDGGDGGDDPDTAHEIFLDQDPEAFRKLLAYMREGTMDVTAIDAGVLLLAEFLGVETLLVAAKARACRNLNPGTGSEAEERRVDDVTAAREFDAKYGGIRRALCGGLLLGSLRKEPTNRKEFVVMRLTSDHGSELVFLDLISNGNDRPNAEFDRDEMPYLSIVGALNWLHHHRFTNHEAQLKAECEEYVTMTFSRNVPNQNEIFIPVNKFQPTQSLSWRKEFAMIMVDKNASRFVVQRRPENFNDPSETDFFENGHELERHGFLDCEVELETLFRPWLECILTNYFLTASASTDAYSSKIFSRKIEYLVNTDVESGNGCVGIDPSVDSSKTAG